MSPPTHRRALLLTDVVDSTALVERLGPVGAAALWAAHDQVARGLLPEHRGREIDKTDGFLLLFEDPADAVAYAAAYHAAIGALDPPLRARAGLHVGEVVLRTTPPRDVARGAKPLEVDGPAKPLAARVMSVARGGQTLATRDAAPPGARSHGHWRLKGVPEPVELFEVGGEGVPPADGEKAWRVVWRNDAWLPVRDVPHALPRERDTFVGRAHDLQQLAERLDAGAALVSLIGVGGTGKTRLVTRYAWTWLGEYPGGVWFCDLVDARDAQGVVAAVARALGVPFAGDDLVAVVGRAIEGRGKCLVILDNFEQVARWAPETLGPWLDRAHRASFLVTTREVLGLPGESTLMLAPMAGDDAEALFFTRAKQAGAALPEEDRPVVADIVRLLDQLPLAVELAAARARTMTPRMLLERMSQRFRLLTSTGGRHTRQATLRATLDWSWDLLSPAEQAGLAQLSVFEGFTLDAAEATLDVGDAWPADVVQALVDKSLALRDGDGRFRLLVSVQEYASERLGADRAAAEVRHGRSYAAFGRRELDFPDSPEAFAEVDAARAEVGNLTAAFTRAVARGDAVVVLNVFSIAWATMAMIARVPPSWIDDVIAVRDRLDPVDRVRAARQVAMVYRHRGLEEEARRWYDEALVGARALGLARVEANLLQGRSNQEMRLRRFEEATRLIEAAQALDRADGYRTGLAMAEGHLALIAVEQGRYEEAIARFYREIEGYRSVGGRAREADAWFTLSAVLAAIGREQESSDAFSRGLALAHATGIRPGTFNHLYNAGARAFHRGQSGAACAHGARAVQVARELGLENSLAMALQLLALAQAHEGQHAEAEVNADAALQLFRALGHAHALGAALGDMAEVDRRAGRLERALERVVEGLALLGDDAPADSAHGLATKVRIAVDLGREDLARDTWEVLRAVAHTLGAPAGSPVGLHVAAAERALRRLG